MHSRLDYRSISEIAAEIRGNFNADSALADAVANLKDVVAADAFGNLATDIRGAVYRTDLSDPFSFAFLNTKTWEIDLRKVREASRKFGGSLKVGAALLVADWQKENDAIHWPKYVGPNLADRLANYDGWSLVVEKSAATTLLSELKVSSLSPRLLQKADFPDYESMSDVYECAMRDWPEQLPKKRKDFEHWFFATQTIRGKPATNNTKDALWKSFAHGDWTKSGPK